MAETLDIGTLVGYLTIDESGLDKGIGSASSKIKKFGEDGSKSGDKAGAAIGKAAGDAVNREFGKSGEMLQRKSESIFNSIKDNAGKILGGIGIATIFTKGWDRLTGIENAQAKLTGLGHTAGDVKNIMTDALTAVKGTAFGLDEAATVAATAVAAGVKPGQELESTLRLVADSAAIAGTSMADMGSIYNKVAATGKLQTEVMLQMQDRGIPVLTKIAERYKITAEEAQAMVTKGKISFTEFASLMEDTVGGAALSMGDTTTGAIQNMMAAIGRMGAGILGPIVPYVKGLAEGVIVLADGFGKLPGPIQASTIALGAFIVLEKVGIFAKIASGASSLVSQLKLVRTEGLAASGVLSKLGKVGALIGVAEAVSVVTITYEKLTGTVKDLSNIIDISTGALQDNAFENAKASLMPYIDELTKAGLTIDEVAKAMIQGGAKAQDYAKQIGDSQSYLGGVADRARSWANSLTFGWVSETDATEAQRLISDTGKALDDYYAKLRENHLQAENVVVDAYGAMNVPTQEYLDSVKRIIGPTIEEADAAAKAAEQQRIHAEALSEVAGQIGSAGTATGQWIAQQQAAADAATAQQEATVNQTTTMADLHGAMQESAQAIYDATEAAKKSGDSLVDLSGGLDLSSRGARDMASRFTEYGKAAIEAATATAQATGSVDQGRAVADAARQAFIDMATTQLHLSVPAAQALADKMGILEGFQIHNKVFTITAIDNASGVMSRIAQLASMLGLKGTAGSAMAQWLRANPDQIGAAYQNAVVDSLKISASDIDIPDAKKAKGGGGGGGGGKSAAQKAKKDAEDAAKKAKQLAEQRAKDEEKRQQDMAKVVSGTFDQIGKAAQKPFDVATFGIKGIESQLARSERSLKNAISKGLDPKQADALRKELDSLTKEANRQLSNLQLKISTSDLDNFQASIDDSVSAMHNAMAQLVKDLKAAGVASTTITRLGTYESALANAMAQREEVVKNLAVAQDNLNNLMSQYQQQIESVRNSVMSFASVVNMEAADRWGNALPMDALIAQLEDKAGVAKAFSDNIDKLRKSGLNETTLNELINAGPGAAAAQASLLASATGAELQKINGLVTQVFGTGTKLGTISAESMYRSGITAAQSVVDGLISQRDNLTSTIEHLADGAVMLAADEMKRQGVTAVDGLIAGVKSRQGAAVTAIESLGNSMVEAFKKTLDIHSPSKVMADEIGVPMVDGIIAGMEKQFSGVRGIVGDFAGNLSIGNNLFKGSQRMTIELIAGGEGELTQAIANGSRIIVRDEMGREQRVILQRGRAGVRSNGIR